MKNNKILTTSVLVWSLIIWWCIGWNNDAEKTRSLKDWAYENTQYYALWSWTWEVKVDVNVKLELKDSKLSSISISWEKITPKYLEAFNWWISQQIIWKTLEEAKALWNCLMLLLKKLLELMIDFLDLKKIMNYIKLIIAYENGLRLAMNFF